MGVPSPSVELKLKLPGDIRAAETARRAVAVFSMHVPEPQLEVLALVLNELVTNSLVHACMNGEPIDVSLVATGEEIRGEVADPGQGFEVPGAPEVDALAGRGLVVVGSLASDWGVESEPNTRVWFTLPRTPAAESSEDVKLPIH